VGRLTLDRPERRNALDGPTWRALRDAVRELADDADVSVVVLQGAGPVFCAGVDVNEPQPDGSWQERRLWAARWQRVLADIEALPQASVAVVQGAAIGGGLMLALACDLRVAAAGTLFKVPELTLGMPVAWGCLPRLVRAVGLSRARDLVLTARTASAQEANEWGLVQRVAPVGELEATAAALVDQLCAVPAPVLSQARQALVNADGGTAGWADVEILAGALVETEARPRAAEKEAAHGRG
jgi:enoyl-CoA hydratase/carnithine racemase